MVLRRLTALRPEQHPPSAGGSAGGPAGHEIASKTGLSLRNRDESGHARGDVGSGTDSVSASTAPRRLAGLDALRGIAVMAVMLYHYTAWYGHSGEGHPFPGVSLVFAYGNFGVDLFFIVSGFVIAMTLERTRTLSDFLVSRLSRLWPAFLVSLAFTLTITGGFDGRASWPDIGGLAANATMMPELFGALPIDGSYWSLYYELDFYLLAGLAFFVLRARAPELPCALWLLASVASRLRDAAWIPPSLTLAMAAQFSQLFVIGVMLYRVNTGRARLSTAAVLAFALLATLVSRYWAFHPMSRQAYAGLIGVFTGVVWLATASFVRFPAVAPLRFLGRISYPLYLVHQQAGYSMIARLENAGVVPDLAVAITTAVMLATAWAISAGVEYPAQTWLRSRYRAWSDRRARQALGARTDGRFIPKPFPIESRSLPIE